MKNFKLLALVLFTLLNIAACSGGDENEPEVQTPTIAIQDWYIGDKIALNNEANERTINFTAYYNWNINVSISSGDNNWCIVTPNNGSAGIQYLKLNVTKNTTYEIRTATITLICKDEKKTFRVEQEGLPKPNVIKVEKAGTLAEKLNNVNQDLVSLIVEGNINGDDIAALRTLSLTKLDLSNVNIVKGGSFEYKKNLGFLGNEWRKETCNEDNVIPNNMFNNGFRILEELILPRSVISIGEYALEECISLKKIYLPINLKTIGRGAFTNCTKLEEIGLPNTVSSIEAGAFRQCNSLQYIFIPEGITKIASSTFAQCRNIRSIHLPKSLIEIEPMAFSECCWGLTEIIIPENVKSIGYQAFYKCDKLLYVTCLAETAPKLNHIEADNAMIYPFDNEFRGYLSVPKFCSGSYRFTEWSMFFNISELEN